MSDFAIDIRNVVKRYEEHVAVRDPRAFLVRMVTRKALDRLRRRVGRLYRRPFGRRVGRGPRGRISAPPAPAGTSFVAFPVARRGLDGLRAGGRTVVQPRSRASG